MCSCLQTAHPRLLCSSVDTHVDTSMGMRRVEITCSNCGGHLGHGKLVLPCAQHALLPEPAAEGRWGWLRLRAGCLRHPPPPSIRRCLCIRPRRRGGGEGWCRQAAPLWQAALVAVPSSPLFAPSPHPLPRRPLLPFLFSVRGRGAPRGGGGGGGKRHAKQHGGCPFQVSTRPGQGCSCSSSPSLPLFPPCSSSCTHRASPPPPTSGTA